MIKTKTINNELVVEGVVAVGDTVKNRCCPGHDWTVTLILDETIWGVCSNPDCSVGIQSDGDIDNDFYRGVSTVSLEDLAVWLEDAKCRLSRVDGRLWLDDESTGGRWVDSVYAGFWLQKWIDNGIRTMYELSFLLTNSIDSVGLSCFLEDNLWVFSCDTDDNTDFCQFVLGAPTGEIMNII